MVAWSALGMLAVVALLLMVSRHASEVFCLSVRRGRVLLLRGRIPPSLFAELSHVLRRARLRHGSVRVVRQGGAARLVTSGIDPDLAQRLRNVFGSRPWRELKLAEPAAGRNLGQRLGWAWLAWHLHDRKRRLDRRR